MRRSTRCPFVGRDGFALTDAGVWRTTDVDHSWRLESSPYAVTGGTDGDIATGNGVNGVAVAAVTLTRRESNGGIVAATHHPARMSYAMVLTAAREAQLRRAAVDR